MKFASILPILLLTGCMSTTVRFSPEWNPIRQPAYVDYFDYYFVGLVGDPSVDVQRVCLDQKPHALQRVKTLEDLVITGFTLGIYAPSTVKIWCGE